MRVGVWVYGSIRCVDGIDKRKGKGSEVKDRRKLANSWSLASRDHLLRV